jgi:cytochrome c-type biogenesis protein CcmH/NrfG
VLRLRRLLDRYRGVGYDVEALWLLGRAYLKVNMGERARVTWQELVDKHPASPRALEARAAIGRLPRAAPGAPPATAPATAPPTPK